MAEGMNRATLIGNLGVDPELKTTNNGGAVLKLRLATTSRFKGRDGTWQENTEWHAVDVWGDARASALHGILAKGARLFVEGEIRTRSWETTTGEKRYATSIHADKVILLDSPKPRAASLACIEAMVCSSEASLPGMKCSFCIGRPA